MGGRIKVQGGRPLYGRAQVPPAKNSVLPLLAASVLCGSPAALLGPPRLSDVEDCLAILRAAGCQARWQGPNLLAGGPPSRCRLPQAQAGRMRASILFAGRRCWPGWAGWRPGCPAAAGSAAGRWTGTCPPWSGWAPVCARWASGWC